jgi:hypothetical protein
MLTPFCPSSFDIEMQPIQLPPPLPLPQQLQELRAQHRARDLWKSLHLV